MSESHKSLIEMVMRNTDYTEEQAEQKLIAHNNDITCVIREYLSGTPIETIVSEESKSTNQRVYQEIRHYLDENRIPRGQNWLSVGATYQDTCTMPTLNQQVTIQSGFFRGCIGIVTKTPDNVMNMTRSEVSNHWRKACEGDGWNGGYRPPLRDMYHVKITDIGNMSQIPPKWLKKGQLVTFLQPNDIN